MYAYDCSFFAVDGVFKHAIQIKQLYGVKQIKPET